MLQTLRRLAAAGQLVEIVYVDRSGRLTQRVIRLHEVGEDRVKAYCLKRRAMRVFAVANILAAMPAEREARISGA